MLVEFSEVSLSGTPLPGIALGAAELALTRIFVCALAYLVNAATPSLTANSTATAFSVYCRNYRNY